MLKRLIQVALLTGAAHVFTLFSLKYLSLHTTPYHLKLTGEVDSLGNFILSIIALGLLMDAVRNIAVSDNWKEHFVEAQQARFAASLILVPLGFIGFLNPGYTIFFFAPVFALNGDYALYGRSYPVMASVLAFFKVFLPGVVLLVVSVLAPSLLIPFFILSLVVSQALSGYYVAKWLDVPLFVSPSIGSLSRYLHSMRLGVVSLSFYFLGLGVISLAAYLYPDGEVAKAYLGIKLYIVFKGVIRIINQSFVKEMASEAVCLRVDQLAFVAGLLFVIGGIIFPQSFAQLFLGDTYSSDTASLTLLVIAGLFCAGFTSLTTRATLEKRDRVYARWASIAMGSTIAAVVGLSFLMPTVNGIYWSVLIGEIIFAIGLIVVFNNAKMLLDRVKGMLQLVALLLLPIIIRVGFGDTFISLACSAALCGIFFLLVQRKSIGIPVTAVNSIKNSQ